MIPFFVIFPLWVAASLAWPIVQSLHALTKKDAKEMKVWLCYWVGYAAFGFLSTYVPFLETMLQLPFTIIAAMAVDLYYEFMLAAVILLVNPKSRQLDVVVSLCEKHFEPLVQTGLTKLEGVINMATEQVQQVVNKQAGGKK